MNNKYLLENCGEHDKILIMFSDEKREVIMLKDLIENFEDTRLIGYKKCGCDTFINPGEVKSIEIFHFNFK